MTEQLQLTETAEDGRQVLQPRGELDLAEVQALRGRLRDLMCAERETVLDLSELAFIDSSGIQLLFEATREAKSNGWHLQLRNPSAAAHNTLKLAGVLTLLGLDQD
jgi:anti-anti-sigma factor